MDAHRIVRARSEIRTCGWLAQVDEHGGSIFDWRPHSKGAADMELLVGEVLRLLGLETHTELVKASPAIDAPATFDSSVTDQQQVTNQQHDTIA